MHLAGLVDRDIFPSDKTLVREVKPDRIAPFKELCARLKVDPEKYLRA